MSKSSVRRKHVRYEQISRRAGGGNGQKGSKLVDMDYFAVFQARSDLTEKALRPEHTMVVSQIIGNVLVVSNIDAFDSLRLARHDAAEPRRPATVGCQDANRVPAANQPARQVKSGSRRAAVLQCGIEIGNDKTDFHAA